MSSHSWAVLCLPLASRMHIRAGWRNSLRVAVALPQGCDCSVRETSACNCPMRSEISVTNRELDAANVLTPIRSIGTLQPHCSVHAATRHTKQHRNLGRYALERHARTKSSDIFATFADGKRLTSAQTLQNVANLAGNLHPLGNANNATCGLSTSPTASRRWNADATVDIAGLILCCGKYARGSAEQP